MKSFAKGDLVKFKHKPTPDSTFVILEINSDNTLRIKDTLLEIYYNTANPQLV